MDIDTATKGLLAFLIAIVLVIIIYVATSHAQAPAAPVPAESFPVAMTSQDVTNINAVCNYAVDSSALNLGTKTGVGQYCLALLDRIGKAQAAAQEIAKKPAGAKESAPK